MQAGCLLKARETCSHYSSKLVKHERRGSGLSSWGGGKADYRKPRTRFALLNVIMKQSRGIADGSLETGRDRKNLVSYRRNVWRKLRWGIDVALRPFVVYSFWQSCTNPMWLLWGLTLCWTHSELLTNTTTHLCETYYLRPNSFENYWLWTTT